MLHCHIFIGRPVEKKESKGLTAVKKAQVKVLLFLFFYIVTTVAGYGLLAFEISGILAP